MSKIRIKVLPGAHENSVCEKDGKLLVRVTALPTKGQANEAVRKLLAHHLKIAPSRLSIARGATSKEKTILIDDGNRLA